MYTLSTASFITTPHPPTHLQAHTCRDTGWVQWRKHLGKEALFTARAKTFGLGGCRLYIAVFLVTNEMCMVRNNEAHKGSLNPLGLCIHFILFLKPYIVN